MALDVTLLFSFKLFALNFTVCPPPVIADLRKWTQTTANHQKNLIKSCDAGAAGISK